MCTPAGVRSTAYAWECASYTANQGAVSAEYTKAQVDALITNANTATATVAPRKAGTYVFKLTVTDNDGESDTDTVTVVVEGYVVSDTVTLTFPVFTPGSATINFEPTNLPAGVTYTLEDDMEHTFSSGVVSASLYEDSDMPLFTQIFKVNGIEVGRQRIKVAASEFFTKNFDSLHNADNNSLLNPQVIPSISLHLEKTITELPPVSAHAQAGPYPRWCTQR